MTKQQQVEKWLKKISAAEKKYNDYYNIIKETREFYKDCRGSRTDGHYNIFWSTIETLKPFLYYAALENERMLEQKEREKEKRIQQAVLDIKKKFGKNAVLKGMNFEEGATTRERNSQIGGHKA